MFIKKDGSPNWLNLIALTILFLIGLMLVSAGLRWLAVPIELSDPARLQRLSQQANDAYAGLEAQQANVAHLEERAMGYEIQYGSDRGAWPQGKGDEYMQLQQQINNARSAHNQACATYNAMWLDEWRAISAPRDLPTRCELIQ